MEKKVNENFVDTPLMKQYYSIKSKHPDAILLFRVGDFYETFGEDAIKTSEILGITLTKRANGSASFVELAGFPYHALDTYLPRLVRAGQRVAICEQLEDPKLAKKIVKRGITELITPGVNYHESSLDRKENNFLACIHFENQFAGIAFLDISTGEFLIAEGTFEYVDKLLNNFSPKEVIFSKTKQSLFEEKFGNKYFTYKLDEWIFNEETAIDKLIRHFETISLKGFGISGMRAGTIAAGAILQYLELIQHTNINHITSLSRIEQDDYLWLDKFTIKNLELLQPINEGGKALIDIIDKTFTPMGARLLKRWISFPLKDIKPIEERHQIVEYFLKNKDVRQKVEELLSGIGDLERIVSRIAIKKVSPRELIHLKNILSIVTPLKEICLNSSLDALIKIGEQLNPCDVIKNRIEKELVNDPPAQINKGGIIADGVSNELDELRNIIRNGKDYILELQQKEIVRTGISSLKIGYNNVFGYYIEVRNTHKDKVPSDWIRKQTLVNAERYISEELKIFEEKILGAEEKILAIEEKLYNNLVLALIDYIVPIQLNASLIAKIDCLVSFARCAEEYKYVRPLLDDSLIIDIKNGRHPVIERVLPIDQEFIPNDIFLDSNSQQIIIITGPNMAGKSAILRQTALIVLLAQIGSFVPAEMARIGIVDKIFTRVGASDNISLGESTFMMEMTETASILNNLSERSLILLDEIGRGTSTYDGISIAWAIAEYLHENNKYRPRTLFATHYHELNEMENTYQRIKNYNVAVKELEDKVIFLRKLVPGGSEHSFGIHVARMAGIPKSIVKRATEILKQLEGSVEKNRISRPTEKISNTREYIQLSLFQFEDPILKQIRDEIRNLDINNLTPIEALNKLNEIKKITGL